LASLEQAASGYADLRLVLRVHRVIQPDIGSRRQHGPLKVSAPLALLDFAGLPKQAAAVMMVIIGASGHPVCRVRTAFQERNQADSSSLPDHQSYPAFLIVSHVRRSGAEAASHAEISSADHRTAPPIRIGAGILPQEFKRKICRLLKLSISPSALALSS
jgi:hypothetical protein